MTLTRLNPGPRMSEAVTVGDIVFLAGQVPDDLTADITTQTRQVLANVDAVMAELGGSKADIASVQVWLADMADFAGCRVAVKYETRCVGRHFLPLIVRFCCQWGGPLSGAFHDPINGD